jgi:hypothetical protein
MSILPSSSFPLLASDQADVIKIFLELMSERVRAGCASEVNSNQPVGHDLSGSLFPDESSNPA